LAYKLLKIMFSALQNLIYDYLTTMITSDFIEYIKGATFLHSNFLTGS